MFLARALGPAVVLCGLVLAGCSGPSATLPEPTAPSSAAPDSASAGALDSAAPATAPGTGAQAGSGAQAGTAGSPGAAAPATPRPAAPAPAGVPTDAARLPWPAATPAGQASLQQSVDSGAQPWLLDPVQTADSYAASLGWTSVHTSGGGTSAPVRVTVRSSAGVHTLTLGQPQRKGQGGIWLVTGDSLG